MSVKAGYHSGDVETRLTRLEDNYAKYAEALDFLQKVYTSRSSSSSRSRENPPTTRCSPSTSRRTSSWTIRSRAPPPMVTVVEAWDFA